MASFRAGAPRIHQIRPLHLFHHLFHLLIRPLHLFHLFHHPIRLLVRRRSRPWSRPRFQILIRLVLSRFRPRLRWARWNSRQ